METERFRVQCGDCFGLCCTALAFSASSDFGHDKPEATPCRNLDKRVPLSDSRPAASKRL